MNPMIDPKRDRVGATPETLARIVQARHAATTGRRSEARCRR